MVMYAAVLTSGTVSVVDGLAAHKLLAWKPVFPVPTAFLFPVRTVSGIRLIPRPSRAHDLVTMVEVGSTRLTSLERVTTGAGSVSRGARAKPNSLGRSLRPCLSDGVVSMTLCPKYSVYC